MKCTLSSLGGSQLGSQDSSEEAPLGRISLDGYNRSTSSLELDVSSCSVHAARLKAGFVVLRRSSPGFGVALLPSSARGGSPRFFSRRGHHWVAPGAARRTPLHAAELENTLPSGPGGSRGSHRRGRGHLTALRKGGQELCGSRVACQEAQAGPMPGSSGPSQFALSMLLIL